MTTLHHMEMAVLDVRERLTKELQFSGDAERQIGQALDTVREAVEHLSTTIHNAFAERHRALALALGQPGPQPQTIEQTSHSYEVQQAPAPKRPAPKLKIAEGDAS